MGADSRVKAGDIIRSSKQPGWGVGIVLAVHPETVLAFFLSGGDRTLDPELGGLHVSAATPQEAAMLRVLGEIQHWERKHPSAHYRVYTVELSDDVRRDARFCARNPHMRSDLPCLYVGATALSPEQRFCNHKKGYKSSHYVSRYGIALRPDIYQHLPAVRWGRVQALEPMFADVLRERGYGVWQN